MRFSPVNPVARGTFPVLTLRHTEKSLLGSELKFSVVGGKKKRGNSRKCATRNLRNSFKLQKSDKKCQKLQSSRLEEFRDFRGFDDCFLNSF